MFCVFQTLFKIHKCALCERPLLDAADEVLKGKKNIHMAYTYMSQMGGHH